MEEGRKGERLTFLVGMVDDEKLRGFPRVSVMFLSRLNLPPLLSPLIPCTCRSTCPILHLPPSLLTYGSTLHADEKQCLPGNSREALARS